MWALALGNADGQKGEGTQGRPESGRPSSIRSRRRGMRRPPPSSLLYAIAWPLPPHPQPASLQPAWSVLATSSRRRGACTNPATPVPPLASHPRPSPYPAVFRAHRTLVRAHAHASEARPAGDGPRTYNGRSPPVDGGAGYCCITTCGGAGLAQGLHGETTSNGDAKAARGDHKRLRREGHHPSLSPLRPLLQGMGRQAGSAAIFRSTHE
ncbi:hypothetical protein BJ912DRAFT_1149932 [Pholiota molesta]|nr:hypothetical protein BJ912DRAFT_1149932 [Pholiota molesta]